MDLNVVVFCLFVCLDDYYRLYLHSISLFSLLLFLVAKTDRIDPFLCARLRRPNQRDQRVRARLYGVH